MAQSGILAPRAALPVIEVKIPSLWRRIAASGKLLRRSWWALRPQRQPCRDVPAAADHLHVRLRAIRAYSQFVRSHPDMPLSHRNRCLDSVVSACEDLDRTVSEVLGHTQI